MKALLDTHALLWWLVDSDRLSAGAREIIAARNSRLYWSAASSWELAIKAGLGRIDLPEPPRTLIPKVLREQAISPLEITHTHALAVADLPMHHRDPFDRMLAVQANIERLVVLSADRIFAEYGVETAW